MVPPWARAEPVRPGEILCHLVEGLSLGAAHPDRAGGAPLHQIGGPVRGRVLGRAVRQPQRAIGGKGKAGDRAHLGQQVLRHPVNQQHASFQRHRKLALGRDGERGHRCVEALEEHGLGARHEAVERIARGGDEVATEHGEVVGFGKPRQHRRLVECGIRPERAVHRRDRHRLAAKQVEDRIEDHARVPQ